MTVQQATTRRGNGHGPEGSTMLERKIKDLRQRWQAANAEFDSAGKDLDEIRQAAADADTEAAWESEMDQARAEGQTARGIIEDLQDRLRRGAGATGRRTAGR